VDVLLHPLQGEALVVEARVGRAVCGDLAAGQPTEGAEAVVDGGVDEARVAGVQQARRVELAVTGLLA
jgi:hypothetical protein